MNYFFNILTKKIKTKPFKYSSSTDINQSTFVFKDHVSIKKIQESFPNIGANDNNFMQVSLKEVKSEVLNLGTKIILKQYRHIYLLSLTNLINETFLNSCFPKEFKGAEIIPAYKKDNPLKNESYRPVILLPHMSNVFERLICK